MAFRFEQKYNQKIKGKITNGKEIHNQQAAF
jgi:hypothetical protein